MPLPATASPAFTSLPEWFIEDTAEFYLFLCRMNPDALRLSQLNSLVTAGTYFITAGAYIKNPYLRAKFVEVPQSLANRRIWRGVAHVSLFAAAAEWEHRSFSTFLPRS